MRHKKWTFGIVCLPFLLTMSGCAGTAARQHIDAPATLTPTTATNRDLANLPEPKGKIIVSIYNFRDQTGQYKYQPNVSSFSTAVTQGATSMLIKALKESGWFVPVEREGLQDLLTERKIIRAALKARNSTEQLPPLLYSRILLEGGIIGYETNIVTGGAGAKYFGIGTSKQYRVDQVMVYLRAVDIKTGRILNSVSTTKSIYSREVRAGVFQFVTHKHLLEFETGYTTNEPRQLCILEAIEKGVASLVIEGLLDKNWELQNPLDMDSPTIRNYLKQRPKRRATPGRLSSARSTPDSLTPARTMALRVTRSNAPLDRVCRTIGPFPDAALAHRAGTHLQALGFNYQLRPVRKTERSYYLVYVPPLPSRAAAITMQKRLSRAGIRDNAPLNEPGLKNAISVGMFAVEENAEQRYRQIKREGFDVKRTTLARTTTQFWLDIPPGNKAPGMLAQLKFGGGATMHQATCAGSPDGSKTARAQSAISSIGLSTVGVTR